MKTNFKTYIFATFSLALLATLSSSCDKLKDLVDPKYGDEKLVDLMTTGGRWKIDSLHKKYEEQGRIITDSSFVNYGEFEFLSPKNAKNPGYLAGYLVRHFKTSNGNAATDTTAWYPGNHNATESIEGLGKKMTIFYKNNKRDGYVLNAEDAIFDFVKKENNSVIIESWRRTSTSNGAVLGMFRRYKLSR
ncbi:MAG: hypothetical protein ABIP95_15210 [Pelobium sp.]